MGGRIRAAEDELVDRKGEGLDRREDSGGRLTGTAGDGRATSRSESIRRRDRRRQQRT